MSSRTQDFYDELNIISNAMIEGANTSLAREIQNSYYLGVIARQLCELTDILIEYKEGKNNDNK